MKWDRVGAFFGAVIGGLLFGFLLAWVIGLLPWCKYEAVFLWVCPCVCGVVCIVYLCILYAPDKVYLDEEERPDFLSSLLGEFASAFPVSLITTAVLAVLYSLLLIKTS